MTIQDISNLLQNFGYKGTFFALIVIVIFALIKTKWFSDILSKISDYLIDKFLKKKTQDFSNVRTITESDITNHDIFNYIDFWMYSKVPTIQFSTEYRTAVFRKYLNIYLKAYKRKISDFVNSKDYQQMDNAKIWKALLDLINRIVYEYEKEMQESGIPKIVIDKMKSKNNDTITLTIDLVEGICNSQFYNSENNFLKVYSILNILLSVLENTISNSESTCNSINGQLKGLTFDGKTEP
jgi:hypothetical protein